MDAQLTPLRVSQYQSRMRRAESCYGALLDHANEAIAILTPDGTVLDINRAWEEVHQLPREQIIGRHIRDMAAPGFEEHNAADYRRIVSAGSGRSPVLPIRRGDGSIRHMEFSVACVDVDGEDLVFSIGRDITDTVDARNRLEGSERKFRGLVENLPDVVWTWTLDGVVTFVSANLFETCGYTPEELQAGGRAFWFSRVHPDDVKRLDDASAKLTQDRGSYELEYRWQHKDGRWLWICCRSRLSRSEDGSSCIEGTFVDITEQKNLEDQIRQSQKMEAIGQLTGGIAHDFNNLLAIILGNGQMLLDELDEGDARRADAEAILEAGERAASLTRQLLMFSRRQIVRPTRVDLNTIAAGVEKMLRRIVGENIALSINVADNVGVVMADTGEIEQIIMNLAVNARDAMPHGGQLTIETANVELDRNYAAVHAGVAPGQYVMLSVTDTGGGMDPETKRRAFEPFFTTKGAAKGTGLGLSTCYGIVQRCHGHISVYSEPGQGTVFKIYLPRLEGDAAEDVVKAPSHDATGTETVLIVEDDDQLRRTIHRVLATRGYHVLDSHDGKEALAICEQHVGPIHLLLTDMVMPGLTGPNTAARVRDRRPLAKVVFMSGYSDHALLRNGSSAAGVEFIQKPFTPQDLAVKVRQVLDGGVQ